MDAVSTSSAVISHEMAGSLDRVFRVDAKALGMDMEKMPRGDVFEFTCMTEEELNTIRREMPLDEDVWKRGAKPPGTWRTPWACGPNGWPTKF